MVTHGGANGVNEALSHGKPMLVVPLTHEQELQAHFVEKAEAGKKLSLNSLTSQNSRDEISELLNSDLYRKKVSYLQQSYSKLNGPASIAEKLIEVALSREPVGIS